MKQKIWQKLNPNSNVVNNLAGKLGISKLVAQIMVNREITDFEAASLFLQAKLSHLPDPFLLKDVTNSLNIQIYRIKNNKKIVIYGDYDVDGITSTVVMYKFLQKLNADVSYYIPNRLEDGYGLNTFTLEQVATDGGDLVITVDCGITSVDEVEYAKNLGLEVIIIDHHHVGERIPDALAIVNPHQENCKYPFSGMAAVGVAFSFLMVLKKVVQKDSFFNVKLPNLIDYLDIVAMGTVADMVPLLSTNRIFVKHGLNQLKKKNRPGFLALANICGVKTLNDVTPSTISYKMAPRLNAAGRIGDAVKGVELILSDNYDEALKIAKELNLTNEYRQKLEAEIFEQAVEMVEKNELHKNHSCIIIASKKWHAGVIGIIASRLAEKYYKPTIMISIENGVGRGSARSIPELHIYNMLETLSHFLVRYGGHKFAAGLTIPEKNITEFKEEFDKLVHKEVHEKEYTDTLDIDAELNLEDLSPELVVAVSKLEPFGMNNPEPNFLARNVLIKKQNIINRSHFYWKLQGKNSSLIYNAIAFSLLDQKQMPVAGDKIDIIFFPRINNWNGSVSLQLYIKDFRFSEK